jgi:heme/copper-type cytochrome/quinol oxidase subunit 2
LTGELHVRSRWWYLLPIFFKVIGGVIAYFVLRDDDPKKAKNCLLLGIVLTAIPIIGIVIFFTVCTASNPCTEFHNVMMNGIP